MRNIKIHNSHKVQNETIIYQRNDPDHSSFEGGINSLLSKNGFEHVILIRQNSNVEQLNHNDVVFHNLPKGTIFDFKLPLEFGEWSIIKPLLSISTPYFFELGSTLRVTKGKKNYHRLVAGFINTFEKMFFLQMNVKYGCVLSVKNRSGEKFIAILTGKESPFSVNLGELLLSVVEVTDRIPAIVDDSRKHYGLVLNTREIECLRWVAAGKTSGEIAQITSLSEHTINHYLHTCCRKLDSVNRIQAVANAIRQGII